MIVACHYGILEGRRWQAVANRERKYSYSCRMTFEERARCEMLNEQLGACCVRDAVLACYALAADNITAAKAKLEEVKTHDERT